MAGAPLRFAEGCDSAGRDSGGTASRWCHIAVQKQSRTTSSRALRSFEAPCYNGFVPNVARSTRPCYITNVRGGRGSNHRLTARPHRRRPCCVKQGTPIRAKADSAHTEGPAGSTTSGWCTRSAGPTRECLLHRVSQPVISSHTRSGSSSTGRASARNAQKIRVRTPVAAPTAPSRIVAFGFAVLSAGPLGTIFWGADALAARCLGCPRGVGAFGGCARARRSRRSVTAGLARGLMWR